MCSVGIMGIVFQIEDLSEVLTFKKTVLQRIKRCWSYIPREGVPERRNGRYRGPEVGKNGQGHCDEKILSKRGGVISRPWEGWALTAMVRSLLCLDMLLLYLFRSFRHVGVT